MHLVICVKSMVDLDIFKDSYKFIFLNPWEDNFRCNNMIAYPVYEYAQIKNIPIILETGHPFVSHISQVGEIASKYPDLKLIITNAGQLDLSGFSLYDVSFMLNMHHNIYMGTAAAVGAEWLANQIDKVSKGRILFESGYPFFDIYMEKYRIANAYINDNSKDEVFYKSIQCLIG